MGGLVEPDTYVVEKGPHPVIHARVGRQAFEIVRGPSGSDERVELTAEAGASRVLPDDTVLQLAALVEEIEAHYGRPQDVEFAIDDSRRIFVVQSRPITTLATTGGNAEDADDGGRPHPSAASGVAAGEDAVLARGLAASPGIATGRVRLLAAPAEGRLLQPGEILVATMTTPDWVPTIRRAAGIVTDGGGMTCHAAIVARELGRPGHRRHPYRHHVAPRRRAGDGGRRPRTRPRRPRGRSPRRHRPRPRSRPRRPRRKPPTIAGPMRRRRSAPGSTSTWRSPNGLRPPPRCRSTASACSGPSSCSPARSTACTPRS